MISTAQNILKTLGYFDLFQYPLTREEIYFFHADNISQQLIESALDMLLAERSVFRLDEFYSLKNDSQLAERRRKGNQLALKQMKTAGKIARFLARFPYVRGVAVSGSLSKNFASEKTDIDFFIVTESNRLWIARSLMHLYKKLTYLAGRQDWFCMNYYVDEKGLEIPEKNIFTAMEIITLVPMQGKTSVKNFLADNAWTKNYFPESSTMIGNVPEIKKGFISRTAERILNGSLGNTIDEWLMNITEARWRKKAERHYVNSKGGHMGMVVGRHFSKPDPKNFQNKVVEQYQDKVQQLLQQHDKIATVVF